MIYLTTGANGAGKTLNTLKLVRAKQVEEGRSVYYNGFAMLPAKAAEFGWLPFDPKDWQKLPDGAILVADECQNEFPVRPNGAAVPEYVRALSEHRRRGFDFFMVTQHPQNIDLFVRRLIGSPGWHRHLKRTFGADMVSVLEWSAVNGQCEKPGAGNTAKVSMAAFPKEVYQWYDSASLHTGKKSIPKTVYMLGVVLIAVPALFYAGYRSLFVAKLPPVAASTLPGKDATFPAQAKSGKTVVTAGEYVSSFTPRVAGLPHTAARYDEATRVSVAPRPAACVQMGDRCDCYTQQATKLQVPLGLCVQIVKGGYFQDWTDAVTRSSAGQQVKPDSATSPIAIEATKHETPQKLATVAKTDSTAVNSSQL